jgi:hypothetical protein
MSHDESNTDVIHCVMTHNESNMIVIHNNESNITMNHNIMTRDDNAYDESSTIVIHSLT